MDLTMTTKQSKQTERKAGRKETLTKELAKKIARTIQQFPDAGIEVTWKNVIEQVRRRYGLSFHRNTLSQKEWDGEKLIAVAFDEAEDVQRRMGKDNAPKYADTSRSRLKLVITKLQAENLALREQLSRIRAQQYDEAHSLLDLRTRMHLILQSRTEQPSRRRPDSETALSLGNEKTSKSQRPKLESKDD